MSCPSVPFRARRWNVESRLRSFVILDSPAFIDDTFKDAAECVIVQRSSVFVQDFPYAFLFAVGVEDFHLVSTFDLADGDHAFGALVEDFCKPPVQSINFGPPVFDRHAVVPFSQRVNSATFSASFPFFACFSISRTRALPTTAPSASCQIA